MEMVDLIQQSSRSRAAHGIERREPQRSPVRRVSVDPVRERALEQRTVGLGWFSIGLGLAELLAPRQVARVIGAEAADAKTRAVLMGTGVRELACGLGLLSKSRPALWAWARFAGDVMDLALLGHVWSTNPAHEAREKPALPTPGFLAPPLSVPPARIERPRLGCRFLPRPTHSGLPLQGEKPGADLRIAASFSS